MRTAVEEFREMGLFKNWEAMPTSCESVIRETVKSDFYLLKPDDADRFCDLVRKVSADAKWHIIADSTLPQLECKGIRFPKGTSQTTRRAVKRLLENCIVADWWFENRDEPIEAN
jgi:hypothetical protein